MTNDYRPGGRILTRAVLLHFFAILCVLGGGIYFFTAEDAEERGGEIQEDQTCCPDWSRGLEVRLCRTILSGRAGPTGVTEKDFRTGQKAFDAAQKDFRAA